MYYLAQDVEQLARKDFHEAKTAHQKAENDMKEVRRELINLKSILREKFGD